MRLARIVGLVLLLASLTGGAAHARPVSRYSADVKITRQTPTGVQAYLARLNVDEGKIRKEIINPLAAQQVVGIGRADRQLVYVYQTGCKTPEQKVYQATHITPEIASDEWMLLNFTSQTPMEKLGPELRAGQSCDRYRYRIEGKAVFIWVTHDQQLPVEVDTPDGALQVLFARVKTGPQAATLFEPPADYKRLGVR